MLTLACSTLCFTQQPLDEALQRIAQLGFRYVDLGVQRWSHVSALGLVQSGEGFAASLQRGLERHNLALSTMNVGLDRNADASLEEQAAAVCALAASHELTAVCINAPANGTSFGAAIVELRQLAAVAARYDVTLCLETHVNCLTEIPALAVRLVESVPNLGLALDPSHFYAGPWQGRDFAATFPHTHIVHLRDAGSTPDKILVPPGQGIVDFSGLLRGLTQIGYAGPLSVEYIDTRVSPEAYDAHVAHVTEMASLAERILAKLQAPFS
ncbi:MAG: sugar phosphate isomerase/epimerase [Chloroflexota bacterium]|nr:sugar phosphate isomerase/epimerase [Chloroflexota bacterium]MDE2929855.1 sugar phosphate isomerase/epimerase [Chloroflexota bacterium]